jgi:hypothetical protein
MSERDHDRAVACAAFIFAGIGAAVVPWWILTVGGFLGVVWFCWPREAENAA